jgi:hypothetical protein
VLVDAEALPGISASIRFARGLAPERLRIGDRFTAEGGMVVRTFPGWVEGGERFEAVQAVEVVGGETGEAVSRPTIRPTIEPDPCESPQFLTSRRKCQLSPRGERAGAASMKHLAVFILLAGRAGAALSNRLSIY